MQVKVNDSTLIIKKDYKEPNFDSNKAIKTKLNIYMCLPI